MSLKAKLEAVIYAAEEPVTLAQLVALFAADALEWKAEQETARAEARADAAANPPEGDAEPLALFHEQSGAAEPQIVSGPRIAAEPAEQAAQADPELDSTTKLAAPEAETPMQENVDGDSPETVPDLDFGLDAEPVPPGGDDSEAEARRQARQRDREVRDLLRQQLDELIASCASDGRGVEIREIAGGYRMATKPECHDAVRLFVKSLKPALKLSLPALETLAVIAYKQPVTAPEVNEIRGVDSSGVFGSLLARKLIATAGRKQVIGRPILYKTTKEFLLRFGLKDVSELPSMEEFEKMAAIELEETNAADAEAADVDAADQEPMAPEDTAGAIEAGLSAELNELPGDEPAGTPESAPKPADQPAEAASTPSETAPGGAD